MRFPHCVNIYFLEVRKCVALELEAYGVLRDAPWSLQGDGKILTGRIRAQGADVIVLKKYFSGKTIIIWNMTLVFVSNNLGLIHWRDEVFKFQSLKTREREKNSAGHICDVTKNVFITFIESYGL